MRADRREWLIGRIYEAALDSGQWSRALLDIAEEFGAGQANLSIASPRDPITLIAPTWDDRCRTSFIEHYRHEFSLRDRTAHLPLGSIFTYRDLVDVRWLRSTAFYNDWWLPQGVGGGTLGLKLNGDGRVNALLTLHTTRGQEGFEKEQTQAFSALAPHLTRALSIQRKLRLAEIRSQAALASAGADFLVVDRDARLLEPTEPVLRRLAGLRLVAAGVGQDRLVTQDGALERLIAQAASTRVGGHVDLPRAHGSPVRITVIPCPEMEAGAGGPMCIDRPAALLCFTEPGEMERASRSRLIEAYGLTGAEARVAVEAAKGDGRAAVAARLGIRETTVRAHLSAIFDKTGVRRQAALVRLVQAS